MPPRLAFLRRLWQAREVGAAVHRAAAAATIPALARPLSTYNSGPWIPTSFAAATSSSSSRNTPPSLAAANPYARRTNRFLRDAERRARRRATAWAAAVGAAFTVGTAAILATAPADGEDEDEEDDASALPSTPEEAVAAAAAEAAAKMTAAVAAGGDAATSTPTTTSSNSSDGVVASGRKLLPLHMRRRIFFKYEKRIREMSTLEKTFDYFASIVAPESATGGGGGGGDNATANNDQQQQNQTNTALARHMTARDLVRAVVPTYPPLHSDVERAGRLPGEPGAKPRSERDLRNHAGLEDSVFRRFDVNGDGLISFAEFVLVVNLLAIPEDEVRAVFDVVDVDGSGGIDAAEFAAVMRMIERRAGVKQTSFFPRPGKHAPSTGNVAAEDAALLRFFFGRDGKGTLDLQKWRAFISELHSDVRRLEFAHYDTNGDGTCSAEDFATSLATAADVRVVDQLLDRAEALPQELRRVRVRQADFDAVARARAARRQLTVALSFCRNMNRPVTSAELGRLLTRISGAQFRPEIVEIIMHVFAASSGDGAAAASTAAAAAPAADPAVVLDADLFLDVLRRRSRVPGQQYDSHHHHHHGHRGGKGGGKGRGQGGGEGGEKRGGAGGEGAVSDMDGDDEEEEPGPLTAAWRRIVRTVTRGGGGDDD